MAPRPNLKFTNELRHPNLPYYSFPPPDTPSESPQPPQFSDNRYHQQTAQPEGQSLALSPEEWNGNGQENGHDEESEDFPTLTTRSIRRYRPRDLQTPPPTGDSPLLGHDEEPGNFPTLTQSTRRRYRSYHSNTPPRTGDSPLLGQSSQQDSFDSSAYENRFPSYESYRTEGTQSAFSSAHNSYESQKSHGDPNGRRNLVGRPNRFPGDSQESFEDPLPGLYMSQRSRGPPNTQQRPNASSQGQRHHDRQPSVSAPDLSEQQDRSPSRSLRSEHGRRMGELIQQTRPPTAEYDTQESFGGDHRQGHHDINHGHEYSYGFPKVPLGMSYSGGSADNVQNQNNSPRLRKVPNNTAPSQSSPQRGGGRQQEGNEDEDRLTNLRQHSNSFGNKAANDLERLGRSNSDDQFVRMGHRQNDANRNRYGGLADPLKSASSSNMKYHASNNSSGNSLSRGGIYGELQTPMSSRTQTGRGPNRLSSEPPEHGAPGHKIEAVRAARHKYNKESLPLSMASSYRTLSASASGIDPAKAAEFIERIQQPALVPDEMASPLLNSFANIRSALVLFKEKAEKLEKQTSADKMKETIMKKSTKSELIEALTSLNNRVTEANQAMIDAVNKAKRTSCENPSPFEGLDLDRVQTCYSFVSHST